MNKTNMNKAEKVDRKTNNEKKDKDKVDK